MVLHVDQDAVRQRIRVERHFAVRMGELERVLQQVADRGEQQVAIRIHREQRIHIRHREPASPDLRLQRCRQPDLGDELGEREQVVMHLEARAHAHFGERAVDQVAQPDQRTVQHAAGGAAQPDVSALDDGEGQGRGA